jgi:hypothetical protein
MASQDKAASSFVYPYITPAPVCARCGGELETVDEGSAHEHAVCPACDYGPTDEDEEAELEAAARRVRAQLAESRKADAAFEARCRVADVAIEESSRAGMSPCEAVDGECECCPVRDHCHSACKH